MPDQRTKALLISVGGSPEPAIYSINELKPECLCFFSSEENRPVINRDILPSLKKRPVWMAEIITPDPHDLLACYRAITGKWQEIQQNWRLEPGDWTVDYTEGTKPMVVAIVLATLNDASAYRYTAGNEHTKILSQINPWDELAVAERHEAAFLFGRARYGQAAEIFRHLSKSVSGGEKHLYKTLAEIVEGYRLWDNFQYKPAWEKLKPLQKSLEMATVFGGPPGLKAFTAKLKEDMNLLERLAIGTPDMREEHFLDLMANAKRRADLEQKYDDAVLRLYRAIEAHAQIRLAKHGIKTPGVKEEQVPSDLPLDLEDEFVKAYRLLQKANEPAASTFFEHWPQLRFLLDHWNKSILAHGVEPVKRERYEEMFKLVCKIGGVNEESLPRFPDLTFL